jgi:hypothetical protein
MFSNFNFLKMTYLDKFSMQDLPKYYLKNYHDFLKNFLWNILKTK